MATQGLEGVSVAHLFAHGHNDMLVIHDVSSEIHCSSVRSYTLIWRRWPNAPWLLRLLYMRCVPQWLSAPRTKAANWRDPMHNHHQNKTSVTILHPLPVYEGTMPEYAIARWKK
jgi:hypothetical protein